MNLPSILAVLLNWSFDSILLVNIELVILVIYLDVLLVYLVGKCIEFVMLEWLLFCSQCVKRPAKYWSDLVAFCWGFMYPGIY